MNESNIKHALGNVLQAEFKYKCADKGSPELYVSAAYLDWCTAGSLSCTAELEKNSLD